MAKYRKKPVVVDAIKFDKESRVSGLADEFVSDINEDCEILYRFDKNDIHTPIYFVRTLEGDMDITEGDYLIKGIKKEIYPCKPDIFEQTYEKVNS